MPKSAVFEGLEQCAEAFVIVNRPDRNQFAFDPEFFVRKIEGSIDLGASKARPFERFLPDQQRWSTWRECKWHGGRIAFGQ